MELEQHKTYWARTNNLFVQQNKQRQHVTEKKKPSPKQNPADEAEQRPTQLRRPPSPRKQPQELGIAGNSHGGWDTFGSVDIIIRCDRASERTAPMVRLGLKLEAEVGSSVTGGHFSVMAKFKFEFIL